MGSEAGRKCPGHPGKGQSVDVSHRDGGEGIPGNGSRRSKGPETAVRGMCSAATGELLLGPRGRCQAMEMGQGRSRLECQAREAGSVSGKWLCKRMTMRGFDRWWGREDRGLQSCFSFFRNEKLRIPSQGWWANPGLGSSNAERGLSREFQGWAQGAGCLAFVPEAGSGSEGRGGRAAQALSRGAA